MSNYLRILKKYGVLIEDNEGWVEELERIPNRKDGETFKQWKIRTFGEDVEGLMVYAPYEPAPQTKMNTLATYCGSEYLKWALENYRQMAKDEAEEALQQAEDEAEEAVDQAVKEATKQLTKKLTTVPIKLLKEIVEDNEKELEPSAVEFLNRYIKQGNRNVNTMVILSDLIRTYSKVVSICRSLTEERNNKSAP